MRNWGFPGYIESRDAKCEAAGAMQRASMGGLRRWWKVEGARTCWSRKSTFHFLVSTFSFADGLLSPLANRVNQMLGRWIHYMLEVPSSQIVDAVDRSQSNVGSGPVSECF